MSWAVKAGRKTKFKVSLQNLLNARIGEFRYPLHTRGWVKTSTWHRFIIVQQSKGERGRATAPRPCVVSQPGTPQQVKGFICFEHHRQSSRSIMAFETQDCYGEPTRKAARTETDYSLRNQLVKESICGSISFEIEHNER